jgi:hypothetical protein
MALQRSTPARDGSAQAKERPKRRGPFGDRSGQSLALVAVMAVPLLGLVGLAVDVGMLMNAHSEAHRAAEAAALAGAGVFYCFDAPTPCDEASAETAARDSAIAYATLNDVHNEWIVPAEVTPEIIMDERKVRVTIRREAVPTYFARLIGFDQVPVEAYAAAELSDAGVGQCVRPFFGPDLWDEENDDDDIPEAGEEDDWEWNGSPPDTYGELDENYDGTGYGSDHRTGVVDDAGDSFTRDVGRVINIKAGNPGTGEGPLGSMIAPGTFQYWLPPSPDPDTGECDPENPYYPNRGANYIASLISGETCSCPIAVGTEQGLGLDDDFLSAPGQKWGPIKNAVDALEALDPGAEWDPDLTDQENYNALVDSPRSVPIAISRPDIAYDLRGAKPIQFNNLAKLFVEGYDNSSKIITGRFLGPISGGRGPSVGSLIKVLRLVE